MNTQIFTRGMRFTEFIFWRVIQILKILIFSFVLLYPFAQARGWDIDFSRRSKEIRKKEYVTPDNKKEKESIFDMVFSSGEPIQELVVLNTDRGFIPSTLRVRQGQVYKIHVVNVNENEKNVSFILDAFSEHHATYYGKIKTFTIQPRKEGIYTFQSPETSSQGRVVVYPPVQQRVQPGDVEMRVPASVE